MEKRLSQNSTIEAAIACLTRDEHDQPVPQAEKICRALAQTAVQIDPDCPLKEMGPLHDLDREEIYGKDICRLMECCGGNVVVLNAVLMATYLKLLSTEQLHAALRGEHNLDGRYLLRQVQAREGNFAQIPSSQIGEFELKNLKL